MYKHERPPIICNCRSVSLDFPIYLWYIYGLWTGYQVVNPPGTPTPPASSIAPWPPFFRRASRLEALGAAQKFGGREEGVRRSAGEGAQEGPRHLRTPLGHATIHDLCLT